MEEDNLESGEISSLLERTTPNLASLNGIGSSLSRSTSFESLKFNESKIKHKIRRRNSLHVVDLTFDDFLPETDSSKHEIDSETNRENNRKSLLTQLKSNRIEILIASVFLLLLLVFLICFLTNMLSLNQKLYRDCYEINFRDSLNTNASLPEKM